MASTKIVLLVPMNSLDSRKARLTRTKKPRTWETVEVELSAKNIAFISEASGPAKIQLGEIMRACSVAGIKLAKLQLRRRLIPMLVSDTEPKITI